jgi:hypothetical protein
MVALDVSGDARRIMPGSMIQKSVQRFSEKIMLKQQPDAR